MKPLERFSTPRTIARNNFPQSLRTKATLVSRSAMANQHMELAFGRYVLKLGPVVALSRERNIRDVGATIQACLTGERRG